MKTEHSFNPMGDRYYFDFKECSYKNGYCQIDTRQDASYYGNWINLHERKAVTYAEGDITRTEFDNDQEMIDWLREFKNNDGLGFIHIDPGLNYEKSWNVNKLKELDALDLLPEGIDLLSMA